MVNATVAGGLVAGAVYYLEASSDLTVKLIFDAEL